MPSVDTIARSARFIHIARRWFYVRIPFKSIPSIGKHQSRTRNNARHPLAPRKYDTAAIGDETNGHSERRDRPPFGRAGVRAGWMLGRARATRRATERHAASIARLFIFFLLLPLVASSREGTDVVQHRRYRGSILRFNIVEPRARFPRRLFEVTERARTRERGRRR